MTMADVLAAIFIFGGGALTLVAYSPIGKALAARIRGDTPAAMAAAHGTDPAVLEELDRIRAEVSEMQERLDFTERLLASRTEPAALKQPEE